MRQIIITIISIMLVSIPLPLAKPPLPSSVTINKPIKPEPTAEEVAVVPVAVEPVVAAPVVVTPKPVPEQLGTCEEWIVSAGITEVASARELIRRESGCNPHATNASSGAYGIPQSLPGSKMASAGADWQENPITQLRWMKSYVEGRYGSFAVALAHSYSNHWY